jgi:hypothetical protein
MKINDIIAENIFTSISKWLTNTFTKIVRMLKFGQEQTINLSGMSMNEAGIKTSNKGGNGRIAEYSCAYYLAAGLKNFGLRVNTDIETLQQLSRTEIAKHKNTLSEQKIQIAIDAGNQMAKSMYESIINKGVDLVFTNYEFVAEQHSYDIEPTGAKQGKGSTDDMVVYIKKDNDEVAIHKILLSLKVSADSGSSQGSKAPVPLLMKMFGPGSNDNVDDFIKLFGPKGKDFVDAIEEFKATTKEFWNSPEGLDYRNAKIAGGSNPKKYNTKSPDSNQYRSQAAGDYFAAKRGYPNEHRLSKLFVALFDQGKVNLNQGDWKKFNEGFKQAIGFDDVITYKAICNSQGVSSVVSSATSPAYQTMYRALNSKIDVILTARPNSGSIGVEVKYGDTILRSLSCGIWKDGTIQFKFNSSK